MKEFDMPEKKHSDKIGCTEQQQKNKNNKVQWFAFKHRWKATIKW